MTAVEVLNKEFEGIRKDLIKKHFELGMKASGRWANSLEVVVSGNDEKSVSQIIGEKYTEQLVFGRMPGKFPPISMIEQWITDKGIQPIEQKMKISTLAFLIARKIAREGTKYFQQGGTDLVESVFNPFRIQRILDEVGAFYTDTIVTRSIQELKQVA